MISFPSYCNCEAERRQWRRSDEHRERRKEHTHAPFAAETFCSMNSRKTQKCLAMREQETHTVKNLEKWIFKLQKLCMRLVCYIYILKGREPCWRSERSLGGEDQFRNSFLQNHLLLTPLFAFAFHSFCFCANFNCRLEVTQDLSHVSLIVNQEKKESSQTSHVHTY